MPLQEATSHPSHTILNPVDYYVGITDQIANHAYGIGGMDVVANCKIMWESIENFWTPQIAMPCGALQ